jgi:phosphatidylglycerophosphatase A
MKHPAYFCALGFGSGLSPKAPGTAGTVMAVPLFFLLSVLSLEYYLVIVVVTLLVGIYFCDITAKYLQVHDHPAIVWDEFVGLWIALIPLMVFGYSWLEVLYGFILFRIFDILKPWPISVLDKKVHGGLGIMLDDVLAGIFAALLLWLIIYFI